MQTAKRVLIVEDDLSLKPLFVAMLRKITPGSTVDWATTGEDALKLMGGTTDFDLVLADINLGGGMHGLALADECLRREIRSKVVICSGLREVKTSLPIVYKPLRFGDLKKAFESCFEDTQSGTGWFPLIVGAWSILYATNLGVQQVSMPKIEKNAVESAPLVLALKSARFIAAKNKLLLGGLTPLLVDKVRWTKWEEESRDSAKKLFTKR